LASNSNHHWWSCHRVFCFKAETKHQFELQRVEVTSLRNELSSLRNQIETDRREWQRGVEAELRTLREQSIRRDFRIQSLENQRSGGNSNPNGFTPIN